jgi:hypothetical protein
MVAERVLALQPIMYVDLQLLIQGKLGEQIFATRYVLCQSVGRMGNLSPIALSFLSPDF